MLAAARHTDIFPQEWPEPVDPEAEYDLAWGKGHDAAMKDEDENPYDAVTQPLCHAEWDVGHADAKKGEFNATTKERHRLALWFKAEGVQD